MRFSVSGRLWQKPRTRVNIWPMLVSTSTQPPIVSLFSSTNSEPLALCSVQTDPDLAADSFVHLLHDSSSLPAPNSPAVLISPFSLNEAGEVGHCLDQNVLHIQSPTLRTTHLTCPPSPHVNDLGLSHPWLHIQLRDLGKECSLEFGIVDRAGRWGVIRLSTFQVSIFLF